MCWERGNKECGSYCKLSGNTLKLLKVLNARVGCKEREEERECVWQRVSGVFCGRSVLRIRSATQAEEVKAQALKEWPTSGAHTNTHTHTLAHSIAHINSQVNSSDLRFSYA